jgi:hypothetical protein
MFTQDRLVGAPHDPAADRRLLWRRLLVLSVFWCAALHAGTAGSFRVEKAHVWSSGDVRLLNARFSIHLGSGAVEALDNGVPLTLELQVQLVKQHEWLWDVVETEHVQTRRLEFHALSRSYLVKDVERGTQGNYSRLQDALVAAGTIENMLITSMPLEPGRKYYIRMRGSLDIEALPTPVRLLAYVSSGWDMDSEWYTWPIDR